MSTRAQVHAKLARERGREMRELIVRGRIYEAEVVAFPTSQASETSRRITWEWWCHRTSSRCHAFRYIPVTVQMHFARG